MIPKTIKINTEKTEQPSLTYKVDFNSNKIIGKTDKLGAVEQAVFLLLKTERSYSKIYKDYGIKTADLIGKDIYLVIAELKRRIKEALLEDNRVTEVSNFKFTENEGNLLVEFDVKTIYGNFHAKEVYIL